MEYKKFSISEINTYLQCPWAWAYLYKYGIKLRKSDNLFFGTCIHEALADFYRGGNAIDVFRKTVTSNSWEKPAWFNEEKALAQGLRILEVYKKDGPYFEADPDWIEQKKIVNLVHPTTGEVLKHPFSFKIDLITKDGYIVDHKTSSSARSDQSETNRLQGIAYFMGHRAVFNKRPKGFVQNLIVKLVKPRIIPQVFQYSPDDEVYLFDLMKTVLEEMTNGEYIKAHPRVRTFYPCPIGPLCNIHGKKK